MSKGGNGDERELDPNSKASANPILDEGRRLVWQRRGQRDPESGLEKFRRSQEIIQTVGHARQRLDIIEKRAFSIEKHENGIKEDEDVIKEECGDLGRSVEYLNRIHGMEE